MAPSLARIVLLAVLIHEAYSLIPSDKELIITVKTGKQYHDSRVRAILDTWFNDSPEDIYFITDKVDPKIRAETNGHMIGTKCAEGDDREALSCKMAAAFRQMLRSGAKWACHFEDYNYVNVKKLRKMLRQMNDSAPWYLGKPASAEPFIISNERPFVYGVGDAGICVSRPVLLKMNNLVWNGGIEFVSYSHMFPDDVSIGYIINHLFKTPLTKVNLFHSHLENLTKGPIYSVKQQFSKSGLNDNKIKTVPSDHEILHYLELLQDDIMG